MSEMEDGDNSNNNNNDIGGNDDSVKDLRERGNYEFRQGHYDNAVSFYTSAIEHIQKHRTATTSDDEITTELILSLCNRSVCFYQMELYVDSCTDAKQAWDLSDGKSVKAAYRYSKSAIHLLHEDNDTDAVDIDEETTSNCTDVEVKDTDNESNAPPKRKKINRIDEAKSMLQQALKYLDDEEKKYKFETKHEEADCQTLDNEPNQTTDEGQKNTEQQEIAHQKKILKDVWNQIVSSSNALTTKPRPSKPETSIKYVQRPVSIREFTKTGVELGYGNFSEIVVVKCTATGEEFALKIIEKKRAEDLAKRQHPNVYNEIQMERRVLLERLSEGHPSIIKMYHAFQDYTTLYYLMDLHTEWGDLWSELRYTFPLSPFNLSEGGSKSNRVHYTMTGCHRSQCVQWMYELIDALEFIHSRGIVHRDLKPENILLTGSGHVLVIDFGTAKDLIETDLNGPEFVGTPDFMSPEAVSGDSGKPGTDHYAFPEDPFDQSKKKKTNAGSSFEADLWAIGAILFILQTGYTPFWCPSPYLAFLKIARADVCLLRSQFGIVDDACWDLIQQLMKLNPKERIGSGVFKVNPVTKTTEKTNPAGYDVIRNHPYFDSLRSSIQLQQEAEMLPIPPVSTITTKMPLEALPTPVPTLQDLCVRAVAVLAYNDSIDVDMLEKYPVGCGNKRHDLTLLDQTQKSHVLHLLDRCQLLRTEPRLYGRFFIDSVSARLDRVRVCSKDFIGLTQMNDDQCKGPAQQMNDPYAKPIALEPTKIVQLVNPLFSKPVDTVVDEETLKQWKKLLKKSIATINKNRPKLVFVTAVSDVLSTNTSIRKLLARISETIPVVIHDGKSYFSFFILGIQCLAIQSSTLSLLGSNKKEDSEQVRWVRSHLEQCRMSKHPLFAFVNGDPQNVVPARVQKKLARGRTLCLLGVSDNPIETKIVYTPNEVVDDVSVKSTDSEEDKSESFTMQIRSTTVNGLQWLTVHPSEADNWSVEFEPIT